MDNSNNRPKSKKVLKNVLTILLSCIILAGLFWGWTVYDQWRGQKEIQNLAESIQKAKDEWHQMQMADTYGGKTPQETLNMYIAAVEKGDYELASKYFILENREKELKSFDGANKSDIQNIIDLIEASLNNGGRYSFDNKEYIVDKPIYIRALLYPNGTWKIVEI